MDTHYLRIRTGVTKTYKKKVALTAFFILCLLLTVSLSIVYAENIMVSAIVPPHYEVKAQGDILSIQTNMILYVNGKKIFYDR
jgi:hypothetical protein